jgi:hypothetical protein
MYEWRIRQDCQKCRFITLLFPTDEAHWIEKPEITKLADTDQLSAIQVHFEGGERTDTLAISLTPNQTLTAGDLTFDGRVAALEKADSTIHRMLLVHGTELKEGITPLIQNLVPSSFLEVTYNDDNTITLRSPNLAGVSLFAPGVKAVSWQTVNDNNRVMTRSLSFVRRGDYITFEAGTSE